MPAEQWSGQLLLVSIDIDSQDREHDEREGLRPLRGIRDRRRRIDYRTASEAAGLHKSRYRALSRLYSGAVLREDTLHDRLEVPIRARAGEEVLAYEEGGDSVDAQAGRLLKISHDGLFVVSGLEPVV